jgi:hypothetical protein
MCTLQSTLAVTFLVHVLVLDRAAATQHQTWVNWWTDAQQDTTAASTTTLAHQAPQGGLIVAGSESLAKAIISKSSGLPHDAEAYSGPTKMPMVSQHHHTWVNWWIEPQEESHIPTVAQTTTNSPSLEAHGGLIVAGSEALAKSIISRRSDHGEKVNSSLGWGLSVAGFCVPLLFTCALLYFRWLRRPSHGTHAPIIMIDAEQGAEWEQQEGGMIVE